MGIDVRQTAVNKCEDDHFDASTDFDRLPRSLILRFSVSRLFLTQARLLLVSVDRSKVLWHDYFIAKILLRSILNNMN
jgi:hypothetical protein